LDVVHVSFLRQYVEENLLPFGRAFSDRALKHDTELADCQGFVSGMRKNWYEDIEPHLVPRRLQRLAKRVSSATRRLTQSARRESKGEGV
jgi:hypothetical protein